MQTQGRTTPQLPFDIPHNTTSDIPLRVKPGVAEQMLGVKLYADADVGDVLELAKIATKGRIHITDKATAVAVLIGQRELEMRCPEWIKDREKRAQFRHLFTK